MKYETKSGEAEADEADEAESTDDMKETSVNGKRTRRSSRVQAAKSGADIITVQLPPPPSPPPPISAVPTSKKVTSVTVKPPSNKGGKGTQTKLPTKSFKQKSLIPMLTSPSFTSPVTTVAPMLAAYTTPLSASTVFTPGSGFGLVSSSRATSNNWVVNADGKLSAELENHLTAIGAQMATNQQILTEKIDAQQQLRQQSNAVAQSVLDRIAAETLEQEKLATALAAERLRSQQIQNDGLQGMLYKVCSHFETSMINVT